MRESRQKDSPACLCVLVLLVVAVAGVRVPAPSEELLDLEQQQQQEEPLHRLRVGSNAASSSKRSLARETNDEEGYYAAGGFFGKSHGATSTATTTTTTTTATSTTTAFDPPKYEPVMGTVDFDVPMMVQSLLMDMRPDAEEQRPAAQPRKNKDQKELEKLLSEMSITLDDLGSFPYKTVKPFDEPEIPINMITLPLSIDMMSGYIGGAQPDDLGVKAPTDAPNKATAVPTRNPTKHPVSEAPTKAPASESPTKAPLTEAPTKAPTETPLSGAPTVAPVAEIGTPGTCKVVETFSHDARGNLLSAGMLINNTVPMLYAKYAARRSQDNKHGLPFDDAMIFDARTPPENTRDTDLIQDASRANMLIIAKKRLNAANPDDNGKGGIITGTFAGPVTLLSVTLIDVEQETRIRLFGPDSSLFDEVYVRPGKDGEVRIVPLNIASVYKFTIRITGSGAVDDVVFLRPSTAEVPCPGITVELTGVEIVENQDREERCGAEGVSELILTTEDAGVTYCIKITNSGDVLLTGIVLDFPDLGFQSPMPMMQPGETELITIDVDAGLFRSPDKQQEYHRVSVSAKGVPSYDDGTPIPNLGIKPMDEAFLILKRAATDDSLIPAESSPSP